MIIKLGYLHEFFINSLRKLSVKNLLLKRNRYTHSFSQLYVERIGEVNNLYLKFQDVLYHASSTTKKRPSYINQPPAGTILLGGIAKETV